MLLSRGSAFFSRESSIFLFVGSARETRARIYSEKVCDLLAIDDLVNEQASERATGRGRTEKTIGRIFELRGGATVPVTTICWVLSKVWNINYGKLLKIYIL